MLRTVLSRVNQTTSPTSTAMEALSTKAPAARAWALFFHVATPFSGPRRLRVGGASLKVACRSLQGLQGALAALSEKYSFG